MVIPEHYPYHDNFLQIAAMHLNEEGEAELLSLETQKVIKIDADGIEVELTFKNRLLVSKFYEPDFIFVQLELADLRSLHSNASMDKCVVEHTLIPTLMASSDEVKKVKEAGAASKSIVTAAIATNFCTNLLISGAMDKIWSLINNLQIVEFIGLFNV